MTTEQTKKVTRQFLEEVFNSNNPAAIDNYIAMDYVDHSAPPGVPANSDGFKAIASAVRTAFPDFKYTINHIIAENDYAVAHVTGSGTMTGPFMAMPASGKFASWNEIHIGRLKDGKFVEHWTVIDQFSMLQQLGFIPAPQQA